VIATTKPSFISARVNLASSMLHLDQFDRDHSSSN
jgi:hypothetical protein